MIFLNPLAFWGLLFIAVPIIIHLFEFRRVKRVEFSNVAFLKRVESKTGSRNKLKRLLILVSRILCILFMVFAFAYPARNNPGIGERKAIYLDNSYSMERKDITGVQLLYSATDAIKTSLLKSQTGIDAIIYTNDKRTQLNLSEAKQLASLDQLSFSANRTSISTIIERLSSERDLILISDFQRNSFGDLTKVRLDSSNRIHLYKVVASRSSNLFVDSVYLSSPLGLPSQNTLTVILKNVGESDRENVLIRLRKGNMQISSVAKGITQNSIELVEFELPGAMDMSGGYVLELEDPDVLFDNHYYFTIPRSPRLEVLIVNGGTRNTYLESAFANPGLFDLTISDVSSLGSSLEAADFIILSGLREIPWWLSERLNNAMISYLLIPPRDLVVDSYTGNLGITPSVSADTASYLFSRKSLESPLFNGVFKNVSDQINLPSGKIMYEWKGAHPIINLESRKAYLSQIGNVFLLGGSIDDQSTNFHKHSLFLPALYQLCLYQKNPPVLAYNLDSRIVLLDQDSLLINGKTRLEGEEGSFVPTFRYTKNSTLMEIPDVLNKPGIYHLMNDQDTIRSLAFNVSRLESDISTYSMEELERLAGRKSNVSTQLLGGNTLPELSGPDSLGVPLWKYALILALIFMITEILLLRFFK